MKNISSTSFVDFKKAFNRVWHAALWATVKKYNISFNLIRVIKHLYDKVTSAVLFNSSMGNWFRTTARGPGEEDKADGRKGERTTAGNGQAWTSPSPRGQWRTEKNGGNWL